MKYDLVFEGGGAKGMVFVGAMRAFEQAGHTAGRLLGTSAGAITATLLACGYGADEMKEALTEREGEHSVFASFMGPPEPVDHIEVHQSVVREMLRQIDLPFLPERFEEKLDDRIAAWVASHPGLRHLFSFVERGGWYSPVAFERWMKKRLDSGTFRGEPRAFGGLTMKHYQEATGAELSLVASDITGQSMLVLNHRTAPDVPVVSAVRMSMNIPLLWQEVIWQPSWGNYRGRDLAHHAIVDGGLLSNFPLELLVSRDENVTALMGAATSDGTLGLLIDELIPVTGNAREESEARGFELLKVRTAQRLHSLVDTALGARDKVVIEAFERMVVRLPAGGYETTEFDMDPARRDALVRVGEHAMAEYLATVDTSVSFSMGPDPAELAASRLAARTLR